METEPKTDGQKAEAEQVTEAQEERNETEQVEVNSVALKEQNNEAEQEYNIKSEIQVAKAEDDPMRVNDAAEKGDNEADPQNDVVNKPEDYATISPQMKCLYLECILLETYDKLRRMRGCVEDVIEDLTEDAASEAPEQGQTGSDFITSIQKDNVLKNLSHLEVVAERLDVELRPISEPAKKRAELSSADEPTNKASTVPENEASVKAAKYEAGSVEFQTLCLQYAFLDVYNGARELSSGLTEIMLCDLRISESDDEGISRVARAEMLQKEFCLKTLAYNLEEKRLKVQTSMEELDDSLMCTKRVTVLRRDFRTMTLVLNKMTEAIHRRLTNSISYLTKDPTQNESEEEGVGGRREDGVEVDGRSEEGTEVDGRKEESEEAKRDGEGDVDKIREEVVDVEKSDAGDDEDKQIAEGEDEDAEYKEWKLTWGKIFGI